MACGATLKRSLEFDPVHNSFQSSAKRRRFLPITMAPTSPSTCRSSVSPFNSSVREYSTEEIAAGITQEMRKMYRRRQLTVPSSSARSPNVQLPFPMLVSDRLDATDSSSSPHQQPLESPHQDESQREMQHCSPSLLQSLPHVMKDTPLFTYRQVAHICESLVRKREEKVKEEYDKVLSCKLAEQYEAFLKFNQDQLHQRFGHCHMSYVS